MCSVANRVTQLKFEATGIGKRGSRDSGSFVKSRSPAGSGRFGVQLLETCKPKFSQDFGDGRDSGTKKTGVQTTVTDEKWPIYSPSKLVESTLENFQRIRTVGSGSYAKVILCREKGSDELFALKIMRIRDVIDGGQAEHVNAEKKLLEMSKHPFLVEMYWTHHDASHLYMLLEFVPGGDLFSYLRRYGPFAIDAAIFYAAEVVLALEYLHSWHIVHRDLKPENLLVDATGHLKLADFGFAKRIRSGTRSNTLCGTAEYLAPEIISAQGHDKAVDWWALGILIHEMLAGRPPFKGTNPAETYEKILAGDLRFGKKVDVCAEDLIRKLLNIEATDRLGNTVDGADAVKLHPWFVSIEDWNDVYEKKLQPPHVPDDFSNPDLSRDEVSDDDRSEDLDKSSLDQFSHW